MAEYEDEAGYEIELEENILEPDRLYMTLEGRLSAEQAQEAVQEVEGLLDGYEGEFIIVNDISEFNPISQEAVEYIQRGKQLAAESGVIGAVRITGESVVGEMQFSRTGDEPYPTATASSREEVDQKLEEIEESDLREL